MFCLKLMACGKECRFSSSLPCRLAGETVGQYARHLASVGIWGGGLAGCASRVGPGLPLASHLMYTSLCLYLAVSSTREGGPGTGGWERALLSWSWMSLLGLPVASGTSFLYRSMAA